MTTTDDTPMVTIYAQQAYGGQSQRLAVGPHARVLDTDEAGRPRTSLVPARSMRVPDGHIVTLWSGWFHEGEAKTFTADSPDIGFSANSVMIDTPAGVGAVMAYSEPQYQGDGKRFAIGGGQEAGWRILSIRVPTPYVVSWPGLYAPCHHDLADLSDIADTTTLNVSSSYAGVQFSEPDPEIAVSPDVEQPPDAAPPAAPSQEPASASAEPDALPPTAPSQEPASASAAPEALPPAAPSQEPASASSAASDAERPVACPDSIRVVVFTERDFLGVGQELVEGRYNFGERTTVRNNTISSVRVPAGCVVTLYERLDCQGRSKTFDGDAPDVGGDFDDLTSSIAVERVPEPEYVTIYADSNFLGTEQRLVEGRYNLGELTTVSSNAISSLRVPVGYRVTLYELLDGQGDSMIFETDAYYVGDAFNDVASSLTVEAIGLDRAPREAPTQPPAASDAVQRVLQLLDRIRQLFAELTAELAVLHGPSSGERECDGHASIEPLVRELRGLVIVDQLPCRPDATAAVQRLTAEIEGLLLAASSPAAW